LGKKSVNIAARTEAAKYLVDLIIKYLALKYLHVARIQIIIAHYSMMLIAHQKHFDFYKSSEKNS
jgi:hypothetical protein